MMKARTALAALAVLIPATQWAMPAQAQDWFVPQGQQQTRPAQPAQQQRPAQPPRPQVAAGAAAERCRERSAASWATPRKRSVSANRSANSRK